MLMLVIVQIFYQQLEKMTSCPEQTNAFLRDDRRCGQRPTTRIIVYDECFKEEPGEGIRGSFTNNMQVAQTLSFSTYLIFDSPCPFLLYCRVYSAKTCSS